MQRDLSTAANIILYAAELCSVPGYRCLWAPSYLIVLDPDTGDELAALYYLPLHKTNFGLQLGTAPDDWRLVVRNAGPVEFIALALQTAGVKGWEL